MLADVAALKTNLAEANRILAHEGVLDAFGHVSCRSPLNPGRFFLSRSLAPELVSLEDILEYDLNSEPVSPTSLALYSERVIHGSIYQARPDVVAICHHHATALLPFCLTNLKLRVVTQLGACIGSSSTPLWDQRDGFGATNHLVTTADQARSLAQCLGNNPMVLTKRHGATVVGGSLPELAFRCIYSCRDAELQLRALQYGQIDAFTDDEIELASKFPDATLKRAWGYWRARLPMSSAGKGS
jgi:ribulose-5-phosphate 4-epimerase/fuculose-1-phosphate aldolase